MAHGHGGRRKKKLKRTKQELKRSLQQRRRAKAVKGIVTAKALIEAGVYEETGKMVKEPAPSPTPLPFDMAKFIADFLKDKK